MEAKRLIAITTESDYPDEPELIALMLTEGIDLIHIRKPAWDEERMRSLIASIDERWHNRLVLHSHFRLTEEFGLHGVHLNSRALHAPEGYKGPISCSCHSIQELQERSPQMDYCTLSPIFNSISKSGYISHFTDTELTYAQHCGIINSKTMALGGINAENISILWSWGFGGACILGYLWEAKSREILKCRLRTLRQKAKQP